ncbi:MAG: type II secretion system protein [Clostridium sartagoforme]|nr:type II secretion system protein [Clostridium sartagoforme]
MKKQSKKIRIRRIQTILILIIIALLGSTLIITLDNYKESTKKIEAKESIRKLILTIETVAVNEDISFNDSDTIKDIKNQGGEKLEAIKKYIDIEEFDKIEVLTLEDARKIINNEVDFEINKKGQFLQINKVG